MDKTVTIPLDILMGPAGPGCSGAVVSDAQVLEGLTRVVGKERAEQMLPHVRKMIHAAILARQEGATEGKVDL